MKYKTIRELIDSFRSNYVPLQVRSAFSSWILDRNDVEEKENVLEDLWDEMSLEKENYDHADELPSAASILRDAKAIENPIRTRQLRTYRYLTFAFASIALFCILGGAFLLGSQKTTTIVVAEQAKTHYQLPDGTKVWLNQGSKLSYYNNLKGKNRRLALDGEAYFDVEKDAKHPFIISTSEYDVKVLGTRFTLSAYEDEPTSVFLESGKVAVSSPMFESTTLLPGEAFTYDPLTRHTDHRKVQVVNHLSWTKDRLEFANATLEDIATNLEHWYHVKIKLRGDVAEEHLSLTVRQEPLTEILNAISRIAGCSYTINGNEITIY